MMINLRSGRGRRLLTLLTASLTVITAQVLIPATSAQAAPGAMRMVVNETNPLLITQLGIGYNMAEDPEMRRDLNDQWSARQTWASLPDELKGHTAFILHPGHNQWADATPAMARRWVEANLAEGAAIGMPMLVLWGESPTAPSDKWTWLENLYRTYPNFVGTAVSELTNTTGDVPRLLQVANVYGGFHVMGSMEEANVLGRKMEDPAYYASVRQYAQNFILDPKNMHENFETANAQAMGLWLAGAVGNWGPYFDGYAYYGCGIFGQGSSGSGSRGDRCSRSQAETVFAMSMVDQWQNGATVFHMENHLDIPAADSLYTPQFYQGILPAMRYMLTHRGPTRDQVIAKTKIAFSERDGTITALPDSVASRNARTTFYDLYEKAPDILGNQGLWYYTRANGRYNIVPRLPKLADSSLVSRFPTVLTSRSGDTLTPGDSKRALFDAAYPAISTGDAFVQRWGNSWLAYNSRYKDNVTQDASLDLAGTSFTQLDLPEMTPHTMAIITENGTKLSMQINNYRTDKSKDLLRDGGQRDMEFIDSYAKYTYMQRPQDDALRTTVVRVHAASQPVPTISGTNNQYTYTQRWDANTKIYTLTLQHNGVVDVDLALTANTDGWASIPANSPQIRGISGGQEIVFDGTSAQWTPGSGSQGQARVLVDGVEYANGVNIGAGSPVRVTGLPQGVHRMRVLATTVVTGSFASVPSVEHMVNQVESADFSYGSAADDEDSGFGSDKWTVRQGRMKLLPHVFPFFGDVTVYNTNVRVADVRYDARMTLVKGTSGVLIVRGDEKAKSGYLLRLDPNRVGEGERDSTTTGDVQLILDDNTQLAVNTSINLVTNRAYSVRLDAVGNRIRAWIDGVQVIDHTVSGGQVRGAGYTGVRIGSRNGGGFGDNVLLDDVAVSSPSGTSLYRSDFANWAAASGWVTETALVFGATRDTRSSFSSPWRWASDSGTWSVRNRAVFSSGDSGVWAGVGGSTQAQAVGGRDASWAAPNVPYVYSAALRVEAGNEAGLLLRSADAAHGYRASIDVRAQQVLLSRKGSTSWVVLGRAASPVQLATGKWHTMRVTAQGPLLRVSLDGRAVLTVHDAALVDGGVGTWAGAGSTATFDDARVSVLPTQPTGAPVPLQVTALDGNSARHIVGYDVVTVKTAKDQQPALPSRVTALYSDSTRGQVSVTWPAVSASQLATATTPYVDGLSRGRFTLSGTVSGTSLRVTLPVVVMPKLSAPLTTTLTYNPSAPRLPAQSFGGVRFDAGGGVTFVRSVYVRWDQRITVSSSGARQQTLTGTIADHPWQKATADVRLN